MNVDDMIILSIDDHTIEPPDMFDGFIPAEYAEAAPQFISDAISVLVYSSSRTSWSRTSSKSAW